MLIDGHLQLYCSTVQAVNALNNSKLLHMLCARCCVKCSKWQYRIVVRRVAFEERLLEISPGYTAYQLCDSGPIFLLMKLG